MMRTMRSTSLSFAAVAVLALAGCGGDSNGDKEAADSAAATPTAAATATPAPTATATAEASATAEATATAAPTEESSAADESRKDEITVRGRKGDTLTLLGQYSTTIDGKPEARERVKVTLLRIRGPFSGFTLAEGHKLIGLDLRVTNVGKKRFDDPLPGGTLILVGGENGKQTNLISGTNANPCDNPSLKLKQGESKTVCIAFDVEKAAKLQTFQYAVDSGYGDTALWRLR